MPYPSDPHPTSAALTAPTARTLPLVRYQGVNAIPPSRPWPTRHGRTVSSRRASADLASAPEPIARCPRVWRKSFPQYPRCCPWRHTHVPPADRHGARLKAWRKRFPQSRVRLRGPRPDGRWPGCRAVSLRSCCVRKRPARPATLFTMPAPLPAAPLLILVALSCSLPPACPVLQCEALIALGLAAAALLPLQPPSPGGGKAPRGSRDQPAVQTTH